MLLHSLKFEQNRKYYQKYMTSLIIVVEHHLTSIESNIKIEYSMFVWE